MPRRRNEPDLYFRADNGVWYTTFYDAQGKRHRKSTHQADRQLALAAARTIQREALSPTAPNATLETILAEYIASRERAGCSADTKEFYLKKSKALLRVLGHDVLVGTLTRREVEGYVDVRDDEGVQRTTTRKEVNVLIWALGYARRTRVNGLPLYAGDPKDLAPDAIGGSYVPRDRALTRPEYVALRGALPAQWQQHLDALVGLGLRESELFRIVGAGVSRDGARVEIPGTKTPAAERVVEVHGSLRSMLLARAKASAPGEQLFVRWTNIRRDLRAACKKVGIASVSTNDLRRTFASWLGEAGVPEMTVAQLMGHTTSQMVRRVYAKIGTQAKADAVALLPRLGPPASTHRAKRDHALRARATVPAKRPTGTERDVLDRRGATKRSSATRAVTKAVTDAVMRSGPGGHRGHLCSGENTGKAVPRDGIEPPTRGFSIPCSTN
jgi:integrase